MRMRRKQYQSADVKLFKRQPLIGRDASCACEDAPHYPSCLRASSARPVTYRLHSHDKNDRNFTCRGGFRFRCFCSCTCGSPAGPNEWPVALSAAPGLGRLRATAHGHYRSHRARALITSTNKRRRHDPGSSPISNRYLLSVRSLVERWKPEK